jgi:hypothetical protein
MSKYLWYNERMTCQICMLFIYIYMYMYYFHAEKEISRSSAHYMYLFLRRIRSFMKIWINEQTNELADGRIDKPTFRFLGCFFDFCLTFLKKKKQLNYHITQQDDAHIRFGVWTDRRMDGRTNERSSLLTFLGYTFFSVIFVWQYPGKINLWSFSVKPTWNVFFPF